MGKRRSKQKN